MSPTEDDLLAQIAEEEARLAALEREQEEVRARLDVLRQQTIRAAPPPASAFPLHGGVWAPTSAAEKLRLFRSLFRGREDTGSR